MAKKAAKKTTTAKKPTKPAKPAPAKPAKPAPAKPAAFTPNLKGLAACVADARDADATPVSVPEIPQDFDELLTELARAAKGLPVIFQDAVATPFIARLTGLGASGYQDILDRDADHVGAAGLMLDIAEAIIQGGEKLVEPATAAFEEVVADLYDGFLSSEDRSGVKMPDHDRITLPPLVKWGNPDDGPYTWPVDATINFDVSAAVVSMPPGNSASGLMAWSSLGHEVTGHDVLHANAGLQGEMARKVRTALLTESSLRNTGLADYWSARIDETSSDVMGILNMGPAAAMGLVAFFRGLVGSFSGVAKLRSDGPASDPHPADVIRGYLAAATLRLLSFTNREAWARAVEAETDKDLGGRSLNLEGIMVTRQQAMKSAAIVAQQIATAPSPILNLHSLSDIQDWTDADEAIVEALRKSGLKVNAAVLPAANNEVYATHLVAAAVIGALAGDDTPGNLFTTMLAGLKDLHDHNAAWGPLAVVHSGSMSRDLTFVRH